MEIQNNCLYRYNKGNGWCKHGIVYTCEYNGMLYAVDTYWDRKFNKGISQDTKYYKVEDIKNDLEFVMRIEDVKETNKENFFLYDEKDRLFIPIGGWHERYLVNKNAKKRKDYIINDLKHKIESTLRNIKRLEENIIDWERQLEQIEEDN